MVKTLDGVTGLGCFVPGQDDFNEDECKKSSDQWRHDLEMRPLWTNWMFDSRIGRVSELKSVAADFCHALILFCKGKALKIVLTNKKGEGFEVWRALVNKYEPTSKASVVGELAEILRTPFGGDFLDPLTTLERKIMIYEAQSRETISDSLKFGCVIAGMGQNSMGEHLLMSATKCDSWTNFVREIESIVHARQTIAAPTPMVLDVFQGNCHKCGKYGHTVKECRSSNHGGAEKPQCAQCGKKHLGQCWIRSYTSSRKDSQKGGWKGHRKGNGKGTHKGGKLQRRKKAETIGKEKVEERKYNVSTKSQNHQKNSGQVDPGNNGQNNLGTCRCRHCELAGR